MNLYLIERCDEPDWDEYDSMVVAAESIEQADTFACNKAPYFEDATITLLGEAHRLYKSLAEQNGQVMPFLVIGSYNAG